jgi:5'-deoxynucleotidase YfbR-like HD superfamily hydrolase
MNARDIYAKWMTLESLQDHMLRTASLAHILLENWIGQKPNKKALIDCCLFHDIAKPMKFDLAKQAQYGMSEEDIKKFGEMQTYIRSNF